MRKVLVLNTTYEPLNVCSLRRALVLMLKDKAEVVEDSRRPSCAPNASPFAVPPRVRLRSYAAVPRAATQALSRRAVFARDEFRCQYCGAQKRLTVDHVVPRSKGGGDGWDNVVTSCAPCNLRKGDRLLPAEGFRLARQAAAARALQLRLYRGRAHPPRGGPTCRGPRDRPRRSGGGRQRSL